MFFLFFSGKTCGLCGNFNNNQNDDFLTPELVTEVQANVFADSWKSDQSCPDAIVPKLSACDINPHRAPWAHKRCNVLRRELFQPCHMLVRGKLTLQCVPRFVSPLWP